MPNETRHVELIDVHPPYHHVLWYRAATLVQTATMYLATQLRTGGLRITIVLET